MCARRVCLCGVCVCGEGVIEHACRRLWLRVWVHARDVRLAAKVGVGARVWVSRRHQGAEADRKGGVYVSGGDDPGVGALRADARSVGDRRRRLVRAAPEPERVPVGLGAAGSARRGLRGPGTRRPCLRPACQLRLHRCALPPPRLPIWPLQPARLPIYPPTSRPVRGPGGSPVPGSRAEESGALRLFVRVSRRWPWRGGCYPGKKLRPPHSNLHPGRSLGGLGRPQVRAGA